ncbi:hypothetical protein N7517_006274 [Penicillium concentricum]|uniref:Uncharacterized protein n=1 Tax=Penicillium concentricum TaxID=293559 RepID=A0A9W9S955_9EURO|nr:uncharacterized protein N7517_006274 [Penicillium concentricum]KAJ5374268.1 hypothetical protein N7517_006274 [Penicillium concentricum]
MYTKAWSLHLISHNPASTRPLIASDGIAQNDSRSCILKTTFRPTLQSKKDFAPRNHNPAPSGIISPLI